MSIILDGSNGIQIPAGSANNPPLRSSDEDTGIFFPSSNTIAIAIDGSQKVLVNANGQIDVTGTLVANTANATNLNATDATVTNLNATNGEFTTITITNGANINSFIFPTVDGIANQALVTDGSGNLSFANVASEVDPPLPNILMLAGM